MSFEATALVLAWGAITVLAFAMAGLLRQVKSLTALIAGEAPSPVPGPGPGQQVPPELVAADMNGAGGGRTLVFMDGGCPGCAAIAPELDRLASEPAVHIQAIFPDRATGLTERLSALEGMSAAYEQLQIPATPFAIHVGPEGVIADAAPIGSAHALRLFVERQGEDASNARAR